MLLSHEGYQHARGLSSQCRRVRLLLASSQARRARNKPENKHPRSTRETKRAPNSKPISRSIDHVLRVELVHRFRPVGSILCNPDYGEKQQLQGASTTSDESWQERIYPYWPSGSDERQYCSLAFDLPVGGMCRTFYSVFEEYHTSADNLELVSGEKIHGSVQFLLQLAEHLENSDIVASRKSFLEEIRDEELKEESSASRVSAASGAGARMFRNLLKHGLRVGAIQICY